MSTVVAFAPAGDSTLSRGRELARGALQRWRARWGVQAPGDAGSERYTAVAAPPRRWTAWSRGEVRVAWHVVDEGLEPALHVALFDGARDAARGSIGEEVARAAAADLVSGVLEALGVGAAGGCRPLEGEAPPAALEAAWSGAIVVRVDLGGAAVTVALAHEAVRPWHAAPAPAAPLVAHEDAVQRAGLVLEAEVGTVEVALAELHALAPGDVIRLGRRLEEPIGVVAPGGATLCRAHLGRCDGAYALEVVS